MMINGEKVKIEVNEVGTYDEEVMELEEVTQLSLCREIDDRNIKDEIGADTWSYFNNCQDEDKKMESSCMFQHSELVRAGSFSENLLEHMIQLETNLDDETNNKERPTEHIINIVKNRGNKMCGYKRMNERNEASSIQKSKNKKDLDFISRKKRSRKKRVHDLRESLNVRECQVMFVDIIKSVQNDDSLNVCNRNFNKMSENEFCVYTSKHSVSSTSSEKHNKCDLFGVRFNKRSNLINHKTSPPKQADKCHSCGINCSCSNNRTVHVTQHIGEKPYNSVVALREPSGLDRDIEIHTREMSYRCNTCDAVFSPAGILKVHRRKLLGKIEYKCDMCTDGILKAHRRKYMGEKQYKCDDCQKDFSMLRCIKDHMKVHTQVKLYKCKICGLGSFTHDGLTEHTKIHPVHTFYKCNICGADFTTADNLKSHRRTHTEEKPYKCDVCGAGFAKSGNLNVHRRIHIGYKHYMCEDCGSKFYDSVRLRIHRRTHTGEKPYKCDVCDAKFTASGGLKLHRRKHGDIPYKCDVCGAEFPTNGDLKIHKLTHQDIPELVRPKIHKLTHQDIPELVRPKQCGHLDFTIELIEDLADFDKGLQVHVLNTNKKEFKCSKIVPGFTKKSRNCVRCYRIHKVEKKSKVTCQACKKSFCFNQKRNCLVDEHSAPGPDKHSVPGSLSV